MDHLPTSLVVHSGSSVPEIWAESVDLTSPDAYDILAEHSRSASGMRVTTKTSLQLGAVWQSLTMISGDIAKLPLNLHRKDDDDEVQLAMDHPAYRICKLRPNREMHATKFWRRFAVHALLFQNAYAYIARRGSPLNGQPVELIPLLPDRTQPERLPNGDLVYVTEISPTNNEPRLRTLLPQQVLHVEGLCLDNLAGANLLRAVRDMWGAALARQRFGAMFFKNGGRVGGILEVPAAMNKTARDRMEEGFKRTYESLEEAFKVVVLRENAKFHEAQIHPDDAQMLETRREDVKDIARFFNVSPAKLGELEGGRPYNSKSEDNRDYLETTLSPWLTAIIAECTMKLLEPEDWLTERLFFKHDTSALLAMDQMQRYQSYEIGIRSEFLAPDEARARENMPKRPDGRGGDFANPAINPKQVEGAIYDVVSDAVEAAHRIYTQHATKAAKTKERWEQLDCSEFLRARLAPAVNLLATWRGLDRGELLAHCLTSYLAAVRGHTRESIESRGVPRLSPTELHGIVKGWCHEAIECQAN